MPRLPNDTMIKPIRVRITTVNRLRELALREGVTLNRVIVLACEAALARADGTEAPPAPEPVAAEPATPGPVTILPAWLRRLSFQGTR